MKRKASPSSPSTTNTALSGSGGGDKDDDNGINVGHRSAGLELQRAIQLSKESARLEQMSEEEQIQEAILLSTLQYEQLPSTPRKPPAVPTDLDVQDSHQAESSSSASNRVAPLFLQSSNKRPKTSSSSSPPVQPTALDWDHVLLFSAQPGRPITRLNGSLDLMYWPGWLLSHPDAHRGRKALLRWLLDHLQWHRVTYTRPGGMTIQTPRFTTTFGRDDSGAPDEAYEIPPKPFPAPLLMIKEQVERVTEARYNSVIVNYYADGKDSISYHSDDEAFLGRNPTIASLSLGSSRDFYLRRKAPAGIAIAPSTNPSGSKGTGPAASRPSEKMMLHDGDLLLMRGLTQTEWEHAVPKRAHAGGRMNLTFRKCISKRGTDNFLHYNRGGVGAGWRWREGRMVSAPGGI